MYENGCVKRCTDDELAGVSNGGRSKITLTEIVDENTRRMHLNKEDCIKWRRVTNLVYLRWVQLLTYTVSH